MAKIARHRRQMLKSILPASHQTRCLRIPPRLDAHRDRREVHVHVHRDGDRSEEGKGEMIPFQLVKVPRILLVQNFLSLF